MDWILSQLCTIASMIKFLRLTVRLMPQAWFLPVSPLAALRHNSWLSAKCGSRSNSINWNLDFFLGAHWPLSDSDASFKPGFYQFLPASHLSISIKFPLPNTETSFSVFGNEHRERTFDQSRATCHSWMHLVMTHHAQPIHHQAIWNMINIYLSLASIYRIVTLGCTCRWQDNDASG